MGKDKIDVSALVTAIIFIFAGAVLAVISFIYFTGFIFYSLFLLIVGIVILFNIRKIDEIEQLKTSFFIFYYG